MIFTTYWFVVFVGIVFRSTGFCRGGRRGLAVLLLACVVFHAHFAGAAGVVPIVVLGRRDLSGRPFPAVRDGAWRRSWPASGTRGL